MNWLQEAVDPRKLPIKLAMSFLVIFFLGALIFSCATRVLEISSPIIIGLQTLWCAAAIIGIAFLVLALVVYAILKASESSRSRVSGQEQERDQKGTGEKEEIGIPVTVNYDPSLEEMVRVGGYDYLDENFHKHLSWEIVEGDPAEFEGKDKVHVQLINFSGDVHWREIVRTLDERGLRPANVAELAAFGAQYRRRSECHPRGKANSGIVAPGTLWQQPGAEGFYSLACIYGTADLRGFIFTYPDRSWSSTYYFLAVSKEHRPTVKKEIREERERKRKQIKEEVNSKLSVTERFLNSSDPVLRQAAKPLCRYRWRSPELQLQATEEFDKLLAATSAGFDKQRKIILRRVRGLLLRDFGHARGLLDEQGNVPLKLRGMVSARHSYLYQSLLPPPMESLLLPLGTGDSFSASAPESLAVRADISDVFPFIVNYNLSLKKMVETGNYARVSLESIFKDPVVEGEDPSDLRGEKKVQSYLVRFSRCLKSEEVVEGLYSIGLCPATTAELLAFGAQYPSERRGFPVAALGTVWQELGSSRYVIFIKEHDILLTLIDEEFHGWPDHSCFLAVRRS